MPRAALTIAILVACTPGAVAGAQPRDAAALSRMPIKEVTVFKDGHALVLHQGRMPTTASGVVVVDGLPAPLLGTFWPFAAPREPRLTAVTASRQRVRGELTALNVRELLEANPGASVEVVDVDGKTTSGRILGLPSRPIDEVEGAASPAARDALPTKGTVLLLETAQGVLALPVDRVRSVNFRNAPAARFGSEGFRNVLTLAFAWPNGRPQHDVEIGMAYVQKGLRWIPSYRVTIDGAGKARVQLQATLVNELADLDEVTANLVVGVPTFAFKDAIDPMALQETVAQLGVHFETGSTTGYALSNAIASQVSRGADAFRAAPAPVTDASGAQPDLGPEVAGGEKDEDLFVFTVRRLTLRKGERMVLPVAEAELRYRDVYTLDVPFAPPPEVRVNAGDQQQREMARLLGAPRFTHVLRLANSGHEPLTTAPALVVSGERVLAQGLMTYTAPGAECDLGLTTAVDIKATKGERETGRTPNALELNGSSYQRVDLAGKLAITNRRGTPVDIEVRRWVLGHPRTAGHGGSFEMVNAYEDPTGVAQPPWWGWYGWPGWWSAVNGVGRLAWNTRVEAGQAVTLDYTWHYFWR